MPNAEQQNNAKENRAEKTYSADDVSYAVSRAIQDCTGIKITSSYISDALKKYIDSYIHNNPGTNQMVKMLSGVRRMRGAHIPEFAGAYCRSQQGRKGAKLSNITDEQIEAIEEVLEDKYSDE